MTSANQIHPFGTEITADNVITLLSQCRSWEDKYRTIIAFGKQLPPMSEEAKQLSVPVSGCESKVWLHWREKDGSLAFEADSDARIVKGLLAVIIAAVHGKSPAEVRAFDFEQYFEKLDLLNHLSQSRSNGVASIVTQIKEI